MEKSMKSYRTLLVGDLNAPRVRVLPNLGPVTPYTKGADLGAADLVAVDMTHVEKLDGLDAAGFFTEVLDSGRSLAVFNLDPAASDLLGMLTGAPPPADAFGIVYRRTHSPGPGTRLFRSSIPNEPQAFRNHSDKKSGDLNDTFEEYFCRCLKRHFQAIDDNATAQPVFAPLFPQNVQKAPMSQVIVPMDPSYFLGYSNLNAVTVNATLNFFFYNSDGYPVTDPDNMYLVVVVASLVMTPGAPFITVVANEQIPCAYNYTTTIQAVQADGSAFPSGIVQIGSTLIPYPYLTSPANWSGGSSLLVGLPEPDTNRQLYWSVQQGGQMNTVYFTPSYSNNFTSGQNPNIQWFQGYQQDDAGSNTIGEYFPMTGLDSASSTLSSMTLEFVNYFTFSQKAKSAQFAVTISVTQDNEYIWHNPLGSPQEFLPFDLAQQTKLQRV
jgi:hypothetical protein